MENDKISIAWLERLETLKEPGVFCKLQTFDRIPLESIISRVVILRQKDQNNGLVTFKLPEKERIKVENVLAKIKNGYKINLYENEEKPSLEMEVDDDYDSGIEEAEKKTTRKRKRKMEKGKSLKSKSRKQRQPKCWEDGNPFMMDTINCLKR